MIIVGELINASRKSVCQSIETGNGASIQQLARDQFDAGAHYIEINAGVFVEEEVEYLKWLVNKVQSAVDCPYCIDSPSPKAIEAALAVHRGTAMINAISLQRGRFDNLIPLTAETPLASWPGVELRQALDYSLFMSHGEVFTVSISSFTPSKKRVIDLFHRADLAVLIAISGTLLGPTPL